MQYAKASIEEYQTFDERAKQLYEMLVRHQFASLLIDAVRHLYLYNSIFFVEKELQNTPKNLIN